MLLPMKISQKLKETYGYIIYQFLYFEKGKGNGGIMVGGGTIWGSGITLEEKVDTIIAC